MKKHKTRIGFAIAILITPFLLNYILLIPAFTNIVGNNRDWLQFYGSYIGAIVGACVAIYVLKETVSYYKKEDNYKHEISLLNEFRSISVEYIALFNENHVAGIINDMIQDPQKAFNDCKNHINNCMHLDIKMALFCSLNNKEDYNTVFNNINKQFTKYRDYFNNIQNITCCVINASQRKDYNNYLTYDQLTKFNLENSLKQESAKHIMDKDRINIAQLYDVLHDWIDQWPNFYLETTAIITKFISNKHDEINCKYNQ